MQRLKTERQGDGTALITIDRADKRNAMDHAFFRELPAMMAELDADPDVHVAVITGAGEAFSAGGDIADFDRIDGIESARHQINLALDGFYAIERAQTVVIAAVNGLAFGGGTELTVACDMAIASSAARFAFKEITLGLTPGYGLVRAPETIGRGWTHRMALTGDVVDAALAKEIGLVQEVVEPERLVEHSLALAARIAARPTLGLRATKRFVNRHAASGLSESIEMTTLLMSSPERAARARAFVSR